jgi:N-acyl-D-amino-acid deacylase
MARYTHIKKILFISILFISTLSAGEFSNLDQMMQNFMKKNNIPGASLAIIKDSCLVYAKGFGYANRERQEEVQTDSLFRIASMSKSITGVAILQLVEKGQISLDDKVSSLLKLRPYNSEYYFDRRWNRITIKHLLQHEGGWSKKNDIMGRSVSVAKALGKSKPVNSREFIRYMMGKKLEFTPGSKYGYSNFGYNILGRVIEDITNMSYESYVKKNILFPLGIYHMELGKRDRQYRAKNEVTYYDPNNRVTYPFFGINKNRKVPIAYGNYLNAQDSHGGWIASASDMARFISCFDEINGCEILKLETIKKMFNRQSGPACYQNKKPKNPYYANGWMVKQKRVGKNIYHFGSLTGTSTAMVKRSDGIGWVILFNMRDNKKHKKLASLIDSKLHKVLSNIKVWTQTDLFKIQGYK